MVLNAPPQDKPISLLHVCHSCFVLCTSGGTKLLLDPYFGGSFRWKTHEEKHLRPAPGLKPEDLSGIDGIVITHDHPDHCQPDALYSIMEREKCGLWGPPPVYRRAVETGINSDLVTKVEAGQTFTVGDVEITALPNRGSEEAKPCLRLSYIFSYQGISVFHGGDSHGPSPSWTGKLDKINLALLWPNHIDKALSFIRPESMVVTHCDFFDPGDFICGYEMDEIRNRLKKKSKGTRILSPEYGQWFWPEQPSEEDLRRLRQKAKRRKRRDKNNEEAEPVAESGAQAEAKPSPPPQVTSQETPPEVQQESPPSDSAADNDTERQAESGQ